MPRRSSLALASILLALSASAVNADAWLDCETGELQVRLQACSSVVESEKAPDLLVAAYSLRARAYAEAGQVDNAIADIEKARALDPKSPRPLIAQAAVSRLSGDTQRALDAIAEALALDPHSAEAFRERVSIYRLLGDTTRAVADENTVKELDPGRSATDDALVSRGPVVISEGQERSAEPAYQGVAVFFGTDRKQGSGDARVSFGGTRARALTLGKAIVTVPKDHELAMIERPWSISVFGLHIAELKEDPQHHFTIQEVTLMNHEQFLAAVKEKLGSSSTFKDQALVFVHGYNVSFDNALYRTAQITYDLGFDGVPFLYSWPSGGGLAGYLYDKDSADQSVEYLRRFIELVALKSGAKKIHLVAHSMGNAALLRTLERIQLAGGLKGGATISQIILAAPDIDRDVFETLAGSIGGFAEGVTLYASSSDRALLASRTIAGGIARAGDVPPPPSTPIIVNGVDTIDVTATSTEFFGLNHSGFAEKAALLDDVGVILLKGLRPPDARGGMMARVPSGSSAFWRYQNVQSDRAPVPK